MTIQLFVPIRNSIETRIFLKIGIKQFYGGVIFKNIGRTNARPQGIKSNFGNINKLKIAINFIHNHNGKFYLTLNTTPFNLFDIDFILNEIKDLKLDGIIVSDINLLNRLNYLKIKIPIYLSTLLGISSIEGYNFFREKFNNLRINKFCLERTSSFKSILEIIKNNNINNIEFFIYNGRCRFYEGSCGITNFLKKNNHIKDKMECSCKIEGCKMLNSFSGYNLSFYNTSCGLCYIEKLINYKKNINFSLKIAGRADSIVNNVYNCIKIQKLIKNFSKGNAKKVYFQLNGISCDEKYCMYL